MEKAILSPLRAPFYTSNLGSPLSLPCVLSKLSESNGPLRPANHR